MKLNNIGKLLYTSILSFLLFGVADSAKSVAFTVYYDGGYTFMTSAQYGVNYFIGPMGLLFINYLVTNHKFNLIMFIGGFSQTLLVFGGLIALECENNNSTICNYYLVAVYVISPNVIVGLASTVFYVCYPIYISRISDNENKSLYFGIGYSVLQGSMIIGNLIGYFILPIIGEYKLMLYALLISFSLQLLYLFVQEVKIQQQKVQLKESMMNTIEEIKGVFQCKKFRKFLQFPLAYTIIDTTRFQFYPYLANLIGSTRQDSELIILLLYTCMSLGSVLGGYLAGSQKSLYWLFIIFTIIAMGVTQLSYYLQSAILLYVGSFIFGVCANAFYVMAFTIMSLEIGNKPKVFSTHNLVGCFGLFLSSLVWLFTVGYKQTLPSFIFAWFGIIYTSIALIFYRRSYPTWRSGTVLDSLIKISQAHVEDQDRQTITDDNE